MLHAAIQILLKDRVSTPAKKVAKNIDKIGKVSKKTATKLKTLAARFKALGITAKKAGRAMKSFGRAMMLRVTLPIAALGVAAVSTFARLEKGLVNVNNLLTRSELVQYGGKLESLQMGAQRLGYSIADTNKGLFDTISALGAGEKAFKTFEIAQRLARGGNTELGTAVHGLTSLMNTYKDVNLSAYDAASALFSGQVKGKTTVRELADNVGAVAPIAHAAGVGVNELVATLSTLTLGGLKTDMAATALRGALNALVKPQDRAAQIMSGMGIIYGGANIKAQGLTASFKSLRDALEMYGIDAVAKAIPNIRAFTAVTAMTAEQLEMVDTILRKIDSDKLTGDGFVRADADMALTLMETWKRVLGNIRVLWKKYIDEVAPELKSWASGLENLMIGMSKVSPATKKWAMIILLVTAALAPLIFAVGAFLTMLPLLALGLSMVGLTSMAAFAPFILGAIILLAFGSAIKTVIDNWKALTAPGFLKDLGGWLSQAFGGGKIDMGESTASVSSSAGKDPAQSKANSRSPENKTQKLDIEVTANERAKLVSAILSGETGDQGFASLYGGGQ